MGYLLDRYGVPIPEWSTLEDYLKAMMAGAATGAATGAAAGTLGFSLGPVGTVTVPAGTGYGALAGAGIGAGALFLIHDVAPRAINGALIAGDYLIDGGRKLYNIATAPRTESYIDSNNNATYVLPYVGYSPAGRFGSWKYPITLPEVIKTGIYRDEAPVDYETRDPTEEELAALQQAASLQPALQQPKNKPEDKKPEDKKPEDKKSWKWFNTKKNSPDSSTLGRYAKNIGKGFMYAIPGTAVLDTGFNLYESSQNPDYDWNYKLTNAAAFPITGAFRALRKFRNSEPQDSVKAPTTPPNITAYPDSTDLRYDSGSYIAPNDTSTIQYDSTLIEEIMP